MSDLWICREQTAVKPFLLEVPGIEIRTIEELCFYFYRSRDGLEDEVIGESLFEWLSEELKLPRLAAALIQEKQQGKSTLWCAWFLLKEIGMYSEEELEDFRTFCYIWESKGEFDRQKMKADKLLLNKKYLRSIKAYQRLLDAGYPEAEEPVLLGGIWHNLGVAHARLFLFLEAAEYFEKAYRLNGNKESEKARETALAMAKQEEQICLEPPQKDWEGGLFRLREEYKKKVM